MQEPKLGPSLADIAFQIGYLSGYRLLRTYWRLLHPTTHGALVTLWCEGEVLLVRHSYVPYYSAPGGYLHEGETAAEAAQREVLAEVGVYVEAKELAPVLEVTHEWEGKRDHVTIFSIDLSTRPQFQLDYREVVEAFWFRPEQVHDLNVFPPLKRAILERAAKAAV